MARDLGADDRVVTVVQYLRVLVVLMTMPLVTAIVFRPRARARPARDRRTRGCCATSCSSRSRSSSGWRSPGWCGSRPPRSSDRSPWPWCWRWAAGSARSGCRRRCSGWPSRLIGAQVGLRFTRASLASIARMLPAVLALIFGMIAATAAVGRAAGVGDAGRRADGVPRHHAGRAVRRPVDGGGRRVGRDLRARGPALPAAGDPRAHPSARAVAVSSARSTMARVRRR